MIFYVRKMLPSGLIRFGVGARAAAVPDGAPDDLFSTGVNGEYRRRSPEGFYFAEERGVRAPILSSSEMEIREKSALSFVMRVVMGVGGVFFLWGILLLVRRSDPIAWILIIGGLAMIITPVWRTMNLRRELRAQAERDRAEREAIDRRNRELVGAFASVLNAFQKDHGAGAAERVRRVREGREIPYDAVAPLARETVLHIGFDALARFQQLGAEGVARELDVAIDAVGLNEEDARSVRRHFYQKLLWHLLADDQLSDSRLSVVEEFQRALRIGDEEVAADRDAATQFGYLRGLALGNLPSVQSPIALKFNAVCHHRSRGELREPHRKRLGVLKRAVQGWAQRTIARFSKKASPLLIEADAPSSERYVAVTNRRVVLSNIVETDIPYEELRDLEVDADERVLTIKTAEESYDLAIPDPIYTAGVIAIASETPRKPKGIV